MPPLFQTHSLTTADGIQISARHFPARGPNKGAILIVPAMGVLQGYYEAIATWLAEQGYHVTTFDYRGTGDSLTTSLRKLDVDILTWAQYDVGAVVNFTTDVADGGSLYWIGHSLGGQIIPFVPGHRSFTKIITVAAGSGYWRQNVPSLTRKAWVLWYGVMPVSLALFGHFPGKRLGIIGNLPKGVAAQWRRWCLDPEYLVGVEPEARRLFSEVDVPICSFSFTDDELLSEKSIRTIHNFFSGTTVKMHRFGPQDVGGKQIGHFGFFKPKFQENLWGEKLLAELC